MADATASSSSSSSAAAANVNSNYIDIIWLTTQGLFKYNALEYFYSSHFYDSDCNNQVIRSQGVSIDHLSEMTGWEYSVDDEHCAEPHLFVIRRAFRKSPKQLEVAEVFYILDGIIYQSPNMYDVLRTRLLKTSYNLQESFSEMSESIGLSDDLGYYLKPAETIDKDKDKDKDNEGYEGGGENMDTEDDARSLSTAGGDNNSISNSSSNRGRKKKKRLTKQEFPDYQQLILDVTSSAF
jgi:hypothetical protein